MAIYYLIDSGVIGEASAEAPLAWPVRARCRE
jgi:hypothetical protein